MEKNCIGEQECLKTCQCFALPDDWQPALNDFYTYVLYILYQFIPFVNHVCISLLLYRISAFLMLTLITVTSISWGQCSSTFLCIRLCSILPLAITISWFSGTMIVTSTDKDWILSLLLIPGHGAMLWLLYNWLLYMSFSDNYSKYSLLKKLGLVRRVVIPNKYQENLDYSSDNHIKISHEQNYFLIGPATAMTTTTVQKISINIGNYIRPQHHNITINGRIANGIVAAITLLDLIKNDAFVAVNVLAVWYN